MITFFSFLSYSCYKKQQKESSFSGKTTYDLKINYHDTLNRNISSYWNNQLSKDSLYIYFENGFDNEKISLYIDNNLYYYDSMKTTDQLGYAMHFVFENKIKHFGVRVNNGALAYLEIPHGLYHIFNVNYYDSVLVLSVLNNAPFYD